MECPLSKEALWSSGFSWSPWFRSAGGFLSVVMNDASSKPNSLGTCGHLALKLSKEALWSSGFSWSPWFRSAGGFLSVVMNDASSKPNSLGTCGHLALKPCSQAPSYQTTKPTNPEKVENPWVVQEKEVGAQLSGSVDRELGLKTRGRRFESDPRLFFIF